MPEAGPAATPWRFGEEPLTQTVTLAPLLRRVIGLALSLEHEEADLDHLIAELHSAESALASRGPADLAPRVGRPVPIGGRVYLDHSQDIGRYNPCFPEYSIEVDGGEARGTVEFPIAYEGPPGLVHGGFLALFFDCVIQDHNCELGQAGKTISLNVAYRRPTPVLEKLHFEINRTLTERRINSVASISSGGTELCRAVMEAALGDRNRLPEVSPRRGA